MWDSFVFLVGHDMQILLEVLDSPRVPIPLAYLILHSPHLDLRTKIQNKRTNRKYDYFPNDNDSYLF